MAWEASSKFAALHLTNAWCHLLVNIASHSTAEAASHRGKPFQPSAEARWHAGRVERAGHLRCNAVKAGAIEENAKGDDDRVAHMQIGPRDDWDGAAARAILKIGEIQRAHSAELLALHAVLHLGCGSC